MTMSTSTNHFAIRGNKPNHNAPRPSLDLSRVNKRAMLVKVPRWIADHWRSTPPLHILAHMTPTPQHTAHKPEFHIKLAPSADNQHITQNFTLKVSNTNVNSMFAFVECQPGQCADIMASISSEGTLIPDTDATYHQIAKTRAELAAKPKRQVRMMTMQELKGHTNTNIAATNLDQLVVAGKDPRSNTNDGYRATRSLTVHELKSQLISLFQSHPYWSTKGLVETTRQPHAYIREILPEVAVLVKRGPYANHWALNPDLLKAISGNDTTVAGTSELVSIPDVSSSSFSTNVTDTTTPPDVNGSNLM